MAEAFMVRARSILTKYEKQQLLPLIQEERRSLLSVHLEVLQNVEDGLDRAMKAFFRRVKAKKKAGFPTLS